MDAKRIFTVVATCLLLAAACTSPDAKEEAERQRRADAAGLFAEEVSVIKEYTDSVRSSTDSASLHSAMELCERRLAEINAAYPPYTDAAMSPDQNDRLIRLLDTLDREFERKQHPAEKPDSLSPAPTGS